MSKTTFTDAEAAQIAVEYTRKRVAELAKSLKELRERELSKAIVPPHKHNTGTTSSSGVEDVPPGKMNPPGKNDALKEEMSAHKPEETSGEKSPDDLKKESLCKMCGKSHGLEKGCTAKPSMDMDKAMLKDAKGKEKDNGVHPDSVLPEDKDSEEVSHDGSGGEIKKVKKSEPLAKGKIPNPNDLSTLSGSGRPINQPYEEQVDFASGATGSGTCSTCGQAAPLVSRQEGTPTYEDAPICADCAKTTYGNAREEDGRSAGSRWGKTDHQRTYVGALRARAQQRTISRNTAAIEDAVANAGPGRVIKSAQPPMAKPPSGKNMGTSVPTSAPATPKMPMAKEVKEMVVHNGGKGKPAPKGADYEVKNKDGKTSYVRKEELDKGVLSDIAMRNSPPGPTTPAPAPAVQLPTPAQHADRASQFASFTPGAGQTGHLMGGKGASANRPGIFGRLHKSIPPQPEQWHATSRPHGEAVVGDAAGSTWNGRGGSPTQEPVSQRIGEANSKLVRRAAGAQLAAAHKHLATLPEETKNSIAQQLGVEADEYDDSPWEDQRDMHLANHLISNKRLPNPDARTHGTSLGNLTAAGPILKAETLAKKTPVPFGQAGDTNVNPVAKRPATTTLPVLKPAATGMHTVGGAPATTSMTSTVASPDKTAVVPPPAAAVARNVLGKPAAPASPVLVPRPAVKLPGAHLKTAGASSDNTEGDKTQQTATIGAKPSTIKPKV